MEEKVNAVVVGSVDKGDFDKYLVLVTEKGKKNCIIKGVRRASSKLRFAGELFSFCEFTLTSSRGVQVVSGAYNLSMNYELRTDYERFLLAVAIAKLSAEFCSEQDGDFLPFLLSSFEFLKIDSRLGFVSFLLKLFERIGYKLDLSTCAVCGAEIKEKAFYSAVSSGIDCEKCGGQTIRPQVLDLLRRAERLEPLTDGEDADYFFGAVRLFSYHLACVAEGSKVLENLLDELKKL